MIPKHAIILDSKRFKIWKTFISPVTCTYCCEKNGKILMHLNEVPKVPLVHPSCHCVLNQLGAVVKGTATQAGDYGLDWWIKTIHKLPSYYIKFDDAKNKGWKPKKGDFHKKFPGKMVGGQEYENRDGRLPIKTGRKYTEADFDYKLGYRNDSRIVYSNDGLIFITYDHYKTFYELV